ESWKWEDEAEGIRYCGAHSTSWDTAFGMRALCEAPAAVVRAETAATALVKAYGWLRDAQMQDELPDYARERREPIRGGWCFSDGAHRWAVSDCTAEAMTARRRRAGQRSRDRARHRVAGGQAEARRRLGRALAQRRHRSLRGAPREPGGDDGMGAARAHGGAAAVAPGGGARRRAAARHAAG